MCCRFSKTENKLPFKAELLLVNSGQKNCDDWNSDAVGMLPTWDCGFYYGGNISIVSFSWFLFALFFVRKGQVVSFLAPNSVFTHLHHPQSQCHSTFRALTTVKNVSLSYPNYTWWKELELMCGYGDSSVCMSFQSILCLSELVLTESFRIQIESLWVGIAFTLSISVTYNYYDPDHNGIERVNK